MPEYYDLSPKLSPRTPAWPTDPPVVFTPFKSQAAGNSSNVTHISMGTHAGSHVDAPRHFFSEGRTVDDLSLDVLIGEAEVVEVEGEVIDRRSVEVALNGKTVERVLFKTENSRLWSRSDSTDQFVGLNRDAAGYLLSMGVKLVGIDYLSIEAAHGSGAPVHVSLLERGVVIVESLDLSGVPAGKYELICLPLPLDGLDGAPARVVIRRLPPA